MFKRIKWGAYAPHNLPKTHDLDLLEKLLRLHFSTCRIDRESRKAKELLEYGVVTIEDGQEVEHHSYYDLVYHKLPYILVSNNLYYVRGWSKSFITMRNPVQSLADMVTRYHHNFLKDKNFHL